MKEKKVNEAFFPRVFLCYHFTIFYFFLLVTTNFNSPSQVCFLKNSKGNGEAKELICTTHGHELRWGNGGGMLGEGDYRVERNKGEKKDGTTVIA